MVVEAHSDPDTGPRAAQTTAGGRRGSAARSARHACLVVVYGDDLGRKHELDRSSLIVGRSSGADIRVDQETVSRAHAELVGDGAGVCIRDLGSMNGTWVNEMRVEEAELGDHDLIKIGATIFKFLSGNNVERAYYEEIYRVMTVDGLTGAYNKRYLMETLDREAARSRRYGRDLSLVMFDIDRFKGINDAHGHLGGDVVLSAVCQAIMAETREEDVLARYGGEEFAVLLPETDLEQALVLAEKLRAIVAAAELVVDDERVPVTISLGVACLAPELETVEDLLRRADERLYEAKRAGRNCARG
jgi:two-component system cell cycle response regulator